MKPILYNAYLSKLTPPELHKEARKQHRINYILTIYAASMTCIVLLGLAFMYIFS